MFQKNFILFIICVLIVVLILGSIELSYNKRNCIYHGNLPKKYSVILPNETGLSDNIIIYNKNQISKKNLEINKEMKKVYLEEHVATKIKRPIHEVITSIIHIPTTTMPINTFYNSFKKGDDMLNNINPLSKTNGKYRMLVPIDENITGFISGKELFVVKLK